MVKYAVKVVIILNIIMMTGCATINDFNSIPVTEKEFNKSLVDIRTEFNDVGKYENIWRGIPPQFGNLASLESKWGKAQKIEKKWGQKIASSIFGLALVVYSALPVAAYIAVEALFVYPQEAHLWRKGDTQIEARVTKSAMHGYDKIMAKWEWKKVPQKYNSTLVSR